MQEASNPLYTKRDFYINSTLTTDFAKYCKLTIFVGNNWCTLSIVERNSGKIQLIDHYSLGIKNTAEKISAMASILGAESLYKLFRGKNLTLCIKNEKYTVMPKVLLQPQFCKDYLEFVCNTDGYEVRHHINEPSEIAVVFGVEKDIIEWFEKLNFSHESAIIHEANSMIAGVENFLEKNKLNADPKVMICVSEDELYITVMNKNNLIYYNMLPYIDSDKGLSYIFTVLEILNLNRYLHEVILFGAIQKDSVLYRKAVNYIKNVSLIHKKQWFFSKKHRLNNLYATYFSACNAYLC